MPRPVEDPILAYTAKGEVSRFNLLFTLARFKRRIVLRKSGNPFVEHIFLVIEVKLSDFLDMILLFFAIPSFYLHPFLDQSSPMVFHSNRLDIN